VFLATTARTGVYLRGGPAGSKDTANGSHISFIMNTLTCPIFANYSLRFSPSVGRLRWGTRNTRNVFSQRCSTLKTQDLLSLLHIRTCDRPEKAVIFDGDDTRGKKYGGQGRSAFGASTFQKRIQNGLSLLFCLRSANRSAFSIYVLGIQNERWGELVFSPPSCSFVRCSEFELRTNSEHRTLASALDRLCPIASGCNDRKCQGRG
jgi:hypothetical protein